jgi:hypothetical protein
MTIMCQSKFEESIARIDACLAQIARVNAVLNNRRSLQIVRDEPEESGPGGT